MLYTMILLAAQVGMPNEGIGVREERIDFRAWSEKDKQFAKTIKGADALRMDRKSGGTTYIIADNHSPGGFPVKSEIIDCDGAVWIVKGKATDMGKHDGKHCLSVRRK